MDLRADIDALVDVGRRAPGSDAERRAAAYLKQRLEGLGRQVEVESVDVWPAWPLAYAVLAGLAVVGSVLSVSIPALGAALALAAALLTFRRRRPPPHPPPPARPARVPERRLLG